MLKRSLFAAGYVLLMVAACGDDTTVEGSTCIAGETKACTGDSGCSGYQECLSDGTSYGPCECGSSSGTGGSTSTSGTGGSTSGTGGSTSGTGGAGGTTSSGVGGSGGSETCPTEQPGESDPCTDSGLVCLYGDDHCECWNEAWSCDTCPTQQPTDGDGCQGDQGTRCFYGAEQCACVGGGSAEWNCGTCPTQEPNDGDPCTEPGLHCVFGSTECRCQQSTWNC